MTEFDREKLEAIVDICRRYELESKLFWYRNTMPSSDEVDEMYNDMQCRFKREFKPYEVYFRELCISEGKTELLEELNLK